MAMGSFEWMEVEALSGEIAALDARLAQARARHNHGLVKVLRDEIAAAQQRRAKYLANISTSLANSLDPMPPPAKSGPADKPAQRDGGKAAEPEPEIVQPEISDPEIAALVEAVVSEPKKAEAEKKSAAAEETAPAPKAAAKAAAEIAADAAEAETPEEVVAEAPEEPAVAAALETAPADNIVAEAEDETEDGDKEKDEAIVTEELAGAEEIVVEAAAELIAAEPSVEAPEPAVEEAAAAPAPQREPAADPVAESSNASPGADAIMGANAMWNQLSVADIEQAKRQLDIRRAEMLARHAEEMKALEADQVQIDTLAQAIEAFVRKFSPSADDASVVRLDEKRAS